MAKCIICGKEIKAGVLGKARSNAKYCSEECRNEGKRRYSKAYAVNRRATDEQWREKRRAESSEYQKAYRERRKAILIDEHATALASFASKEEIKEYLNEHFRLRLS